MNAATGRLPDWIIVGAMKSGTTSLARWLEAHPQAWLVPDKEIHYFNREHHRGADWYRAQFSSAPEEARAGEASPSYLFHPEAPARMAALVPRARLIACLRDPVARAHSHYWHNRRLALEDRSFEDAIAAELDTPTWEPPGYLSRGRYAVQLERLYEHYSPGSVLVVLTDDLAADRLRTTFLSVCRHVGIEEHAAALIGSPRNQATEIRAPRLYRSMFRFRLWRWIPRPARPSVARAFHRPLDYGPLDPATSARLRDWFADDDDALERLIGRTLPWR